MKGVVTEIIMINGDCFKIFILIYGFFIAPRVVLRMWNTKQSDLLVSRDSQTVYAYQKNIYSVSGYRLTKRSREVHPQEVTA